MYLRYMDGSEADDKLFDLSLYERRKQVARMMDWPVHDLRQALPLDAIDHLLGIRQFEGQRRFEAELHKMLSPHPAL